MRLKGRLVVVFAVSAEPLKQCLVQEKASDQQRQPQSVNQLKPKFWNFGHKKWYEKQIRDRDCQQDALSKRNALLGVTML